MFTHRGAALERRGAAAWLGAAVHAQPYSGQGMVLYLGAAPGNSLLTSALLTAHSSLKTAHYSLLTAHCSLLTAHCSLAGAYAVQGTCKPGYSLAAQGSPGSHFLQGAVSIHRQDSVI